MIELQTELALLSAPATRRDFLRWSGISVLAAITGCGHRGSESPAPPSGPTFENNDTGVLNYLLALEQVEAAFFTRVLASPWGGMTSEEAAALADLRDHEIVHRDYLRARIGSAAIGALETSFPQVDFSDRASVLGAGRSIEDVVVSAYVGSSRLLPEALVQITAKLASVEGRHASVIRDLLEPRTAAFAGSDVVDPASGLGELRYPSSVLPAVDPFIVTPFTSRLP